MYNISKLSEDSFKFINHLTSANKARSDIASITLGRFLAYREPMPSSELNDIQMYFNNQVKLPLMSLMASINELMVINTDEVFKYVLKFYTYRYNTIFDNGVIMTLNKESVIEDYFKISKVLDAQTISTLKENQEQIMFLNNGFYKLIADITKN